MNAKNLSTDLWEMRRSLELTRLDYRGPFLAGHPRLVPLPRATRVTQNAGGIGDLLDPGSLNLEYPILFIPRLLPPGCQIYMRFHAT